MTPATILNYMKNIIRFLQFLTFEYEFEEADPGHRARCDFFKEFIQTVRKAVSKAHSQKIVEKK